MSTDLVGDGGSKRSGTVSARGAKGGKRNAEMIGATAVAAYSKCLMVFGGKDGPAHGYKLFLTRLQTREQRQQKYIHPLFLF